jgi:hypothetical protein
MKVSQLPVWSSWTQTVVNAVTVKLAVEVRPAESVAETVTVVTPTGNAWGEVMTALPIVKTGVTGFPQESVAEAVNDIVTELWPTRIGAVMFPGACKAGGTPEAYS